MDHMGKDEASLKQGRVEIVLFVVLIQCGNPRQPGFLLSLCASCLLVVRKYTSLSFILSAGSFLERIFFFFNAKWSKLRAYGKIIYIQFIIEFY